MSTTAEDTPAPPVAYLVADTHRLIEDALESFGAIVSFGEGAKGFTLRQWHESLEAKLEALIAETVILRQALGGDRASLAARLSALCAENVALLAENTRLRQQRVKRVERDADGRIERIVETCQ